MAARLADSVGGHERCRRCEVDGEVIGDDEIRAAARGNGDAVAPARSGARGGGGAIDDSPDERFVPLQDVQTLAFDPRAHAPLVAAVARPARKLRQQLRDGATSTQVVRARLRGRFDPGRAPTLVTRRDPRIMASRRVTPPRRLPRVRWTAPRWTVGHLDRASSSTHARRGGARNAGVELRVWGFTTRSSSTPRRPARAAHAMVAAGATTTPAPLVREPGRAPQLHAASGAADDQRRAADRVLDLGVARVRRRARLPRGDLLRPGGMQPLREVCFP